MYNKLFASRSVISFFILVTFFLSCVLRIAVIMSGDYRQMQEKQQSYKIDVCKLRGTIYDCNMIPITNSKCKTVAAFLPTEYSLKAVGGAVFDENERKNIIDDLNKDEIVICAINDNCVGNEIATTKIYSNDKENLLACHIIGYTDSTGHGVTGLELAYDDLLYSEKSVSAVFSTTGKGNILLGIKPYFENDSSIILNGVVSTIDINIQSVVETAAQKMNSGCAVVCEVSTGKIRAMASVPTFDVSDISASLSSENSPMINRALLSFNVGSVFKPCVAAAAIEDNKYNHKFNCEGNIQIADRFFKCHKLTGHGEVDLCTSLAQSCNCFFYDLSSKIEGKSIYNMANALNIGSKIRIADNLSANAGNLPKKSTLKNLGTLANLSIGQGNLLASPVSMLNLYMCIAGDGTYRLPSIVEKTIKNGVHTDFEQQNPTRVMSKNTANLLRQYLMKVITEGTGAEAAPQKCSAAGKTATAQTGRYYNNGQEITNSWFCGFFPAENPKYVVVVMSDNKLNVTTASIFAEIADEITQLEFKNSESND